MASIKNIKATLNDPQYEQMFNKAIATTIGPHG
ncbi:Uncharacterised protein [Actinobaculum suis]|uniref:Uncharacterized protein n=1 Tax=Actinobaculum suis TaxID=1657 RepID=A0A7Z9C7V9_9ACTO|nr:Uncharacterised protein [Actinobaculum suis]